MISYKNFSIFKQGSRTYFYSSLFFPSDIKADVFTLYSFVRTADNFVDQKIPDIEGFTNFRNEYSTALYGGSSTNEIINGFVELSHRRDFDPSWIEVFLDTMESDLETSTYKSPEATNRYMYGSAEVIGLMMVNIMDLSSSARPYAQELGRSMQYVNFIRDIAEDVELGRNYFPQTEMKKYGLKSLDYQHVSQRKQDFKKFITAQLKRYSTYQEAGQSGYHYIPRRYLIPIKTASDLYNWSAMQIAKDPMIVYQKKMKPPTMVIAATLLKNIFTTL